MGIDNRTKGRRQVEALKTLGDEKGCSLQDLAGEGIAEKF